MSDKNPLITALQGLFDRLNLLHFRLHFLAQRTKDTKQLVKKHLDRMPRKDHLFFTSTSLPFSDLQLQQPALYASGGRAAVDREYLSLLDDILQHFAARTFAQGYEVFESYLKDVLAANLLANPSEADRQRKAKFDADRKSKGLRDSQLRYWREYVSFTCHGEKQRGLFQTHTQLGPRCCCGGIQELAKT